MKMNNKIYKKKTTKNLLIYCCCCFTACKVINYMNFLKVFIFTFYEVYCFCGVEIQNQNYSLYILWLL